MKVAVCNSVGIDANGYAMIHFPSPLDQQRKRPQHFYILSLAKSSFKTIPDEAHILAGC